MRTLTRAEWPSTFLGLAVIAFIVLVALGSSGGLRGSDQYWYVADVDMLSSSWQANTNNIFPPAILAGDELPRPFVHNVLPLYLVAPVALVAGPYGSWIFMNTAAILAGAALLYSLVNRRGSRKCAALAAALYLLLPITIWLATQPLAEPILSLAVIGALWLFDRAETKVRLWLALTLILGLLTWSRPSFLPLLSLAPVAFLIYSKREPDRLRTALFLGIVAVGMASAWPLIAEQNTSCSVRHYFAGANGDMNCYFDLDEPSVSVAGLVTKALTGLRQQVVPTSLAATVQILPVTILGLFWAVIVVRKRQVDRLVAGTASVVLLHLAVAAGYQNQARYSLLIAPPLIASLAVLLSGSKNDANWLRPAAAVSFSILILFGATISWAAMSEGRQEGQDLRQVQSILDASVAPNDVLLVEWNSGSSLAIAYAARPNEVLFLRSGYPENQLRMLASAVNASWLVGMADTNLTRSLEANPVADIVGFGNPVLHRISPITDPSR